jgi:hypothetical protein
MARPEKTGASPNGKAGGSVGGRLDEQPPVSQNRGGVGMASHGHRGFRKLLLGTQTSEVLADGSVPVLVVR